MNKNTIFGFLLIFALIIGYSIWMSPSKEDLIKARIRRDSLERIQKADSIARIVASASKDTAIKKNNSEQATAGITQNDTSHQDAGKYGYFSGAASGSKKSYSIENDLIKVKISTLGGRPELVQLKKFQTHDSLPLQLFKADSSLFGIEFNTADLRTINTNNFYFKPVFYGAKTGDSISVTGTDSLRFGMRLYAGKSDSAKGYIEFLYTLRGNEYMTGFSIHIVGMKGVFADNSRDLALLWQTNMVQQEKSFKTEQTQSTIYYMDNTRDVSYLKETKNDNENLTTPVKWVSFKDQFFSATLIADDKFNSAKLATINHPENKERNLKMMTAEFSLSFDPSRDGEYNFKYYFGPNKFRTLRNYDLKLERQIPLGWSFAPIAWFNRLFVVTIFNWLEKYGLNYGIIILIMTIMLKIVLFPIAFKTYTSSAKMRVLKPEVDEINAKYPKKEDAMKKQQATMELYKKAGANPMAGCLPMLLQMPILLAMFRFFPASIELRQQSFLWAHDLSSYDSILNLPFTIPMYGDHVSLFTLLMTISTIIYTKLNNDMMGSTQQMPGMKTMMYIMPVMFLGFFNNYSAGLSYYYLLANLFTFGQMWLMRKFVDEDKVHARIQENKKKPVKKSAFQKRLEEMTKQQSYQAKRR
jgi:YidC/Oxa1 family membrane protein insertase